MFAIWMYPGAPLLSPLLRMITQISEAPVTTRYARRPEERGFLIRQQVLQTQKGTHRAFGRRFS